MREVIPYFDIDSKFITHCQQGKQRIYGKVLSSDDSQSYTATEGGKLMRNIPIVAVDDSKVEIKEGTLQVADVHFIDGDEVIFAVRLTRKQIEDLIIELQKTKQELSSQL